MKKTILFCCLWLVVGGLKAQSPSIDSLETALKTNFKTANAHKALAAHYYEHDAIKALLSFGVFWATYDLDSALIEEAQRFRKLVVGETIANENGEIVLILNDDMLSGNDKHDDFSLMQFFLQMNHAALSSPTGQNLTYREVLYSTFDKMTNVLAETGYGKRGFYWEHYVPFYITLKREGQLPGFIETLLLRTKTIVATKIEMGIDLEDVASFETWLVNYIQNIENID